MDTNGYSESPPSQPERIYLSPPHLNGAEWPALQAALGSNWIAPMGPQLQAFERAVCERIDCRSAAGLSSGTAALHLALRLVGVGPGDTVLCPTNTFIATANPILYLNARPVFIDSEPHSWNIDPALVQKAFTSQAKAGCIPKALIVAHIYGQSADLDPLLELCDHYGVPLIEDAAEALGTTYRGRPIGALGRCGCFSFNGNKLITTSGGGMLVSDDEALITQAYFLATQAREPAPHYEHAKLGYNYRMSNLLAAVGLAQWQTLDERIAARRSVFDYYVTHLGHLPGVSFMPEATFGQSNRWLSCMLIDPTQAGTDREQLRRTLEIANIEARPLWKPLHLQPLFKDCPYLGGSVAETLFAQGLCLPSGSNLTSTDRQRIVDAILADFARKGV